MKKVIVIGAAVMDAILKSKALKVVRGHEVPGGMAICEMVGGKLEAEQGVLTTGGGGTNVSVGLHRLGEAVKIISRIGNDDLSKVMEKQLVREDIDLTMMQICEGKIGLSSVLVAPGGGRSIVTYRGESGEIEEKEIDWEMVKRADWIQISSLGGEIQLLEDLVAFALENGIKVGMNPGKKELEQKNRLLELMPKVDFFNVNRMEASQLTGVEFEKEPEIVKSLADAGARMLAITDGKRGASLVMNRRWVKMDAFPAESVDDTGAGDGFVSGAVAGILQEKQMEEVLKMGLANGGSVVMKLGAKEGLLSKGEMEKWMKKKVKMVEEWV